MNNSTSKDFDLAKADELWFSYTKSRQFAKTLFIVELIGYQIFFGNTSIVNCKLGLNMRYQKRTVTTVLSDLGYEIVSFYSQTDRELHGNAKHTYSVITFKTAGGK